MKAANAGQFILVDNISFCPILALSALTGSTLISSLTPPVMGLCPHKLIVCVVSGQHGLLMWVTLVIRLLWRKTQQLIMHYGWMIHTFGKQEKKLVIIKVFLFILFSLWSQQCGTPVCQEGRELGCWVPFHSSPASKGKQHSSQTTVNSYSSFSHVLILPLKGFL